MRRGATIHILATVLLAIIIGNSNTAAQHTDTLPAIAVNEKEIPVNAFRATYFNTPGEVLHTEVVPNPRHYREFTFGHWIGYLEFKEETVRSIEIFQGLNRSQVIINGETVWDQKGYSRSIPYTFSKGRHLVEVTFEQRHSPGFLISFNEKKQILNHNELAQQLQPLKPFDIHYCGTYKNNNPDGAITISFRADKKPSILFLNSYEGVIWDFDNQGLNHLKAVVVSSKKHGTAIVNLTKNMPIFYLKRLATSYSFIPVSKADFNSTFKITALQILSMTGQKPVSFSGKEQLSQVDIPMRRLTEEDYRKIGMTHKPTDFDIFTEHPRKIDVVFEPETTLKPDSPKKKSRDRTQRVFPSRPSWGTKLNPHNDIPLNAFKAFYFNVHTPGLPAVTEIVPDIGVNYGLRGFHGIRAEDFAGYWVGNFEFSTDSTMRLSISQSHATSRVSIDERVVYVGGGDPNLIIELSRGIHKIEFEHANSWHTVDMSMTLEEYNALLTYEEIRSRLQQQLAEHTETAFVGVYDSESPDHSITVNVRDMGKPLFLILHSYDPIKWIVQGAGKSRIEAVLLSSFKSQSTLNGDVDADLPLYFFRFYNSAFQLLPKCKCFSGHFHCEGQNFLPMMDYVEIVTGQRTSYFSGKYSAKIIDVPEVTLDDKQIVILKKDRLLISSRRQACEGQPEATRDKHAKSMPSTAEEELVYNTAVDFMNSLMHNNYKKLTGLCTNLRPK